MKNLTLKEVKELCETQMREVKSCKGCPFYHPEERKLKRDTLISWCEVFELPNNLWEFDEGEQNGL